MSLNWNWLYEKHAEIIAPNWHNDEVDLEFNGREVDCNDCPWETFMAILASSWMWWKHNVMNVPKKLHGEFNLKLNGIQVNLAENSWKTWRSN